MATETGRFLILAGIPAEARIAVVTTIASSHCRTDVAPVSDLRISALSAGFPGLRKQRRTKVKSSKMETGGMTALHCHGARG